MYTHTHARHDMCKNVTLYIRSVVFCGTSNHASVWHHITELRVRQKTGHETPNKAVGGDNGRSWYPSVTWNMEMKPFQFTSWFLIPYTGSKGTQNKREKVTMGEQARTAPPIAKFFFNSGFIAPHFVISSLVITLSLPPCCQVIPVHCETHRLLTPLLYRYSQQSQLHRCNKCL